MTTKNRILSLALSLLMVVALFAPMATVFAEDSLTIVAASDNGGTTATSHAKEAVGLGSGTSWYSANRTNLPDKISIATYTLSQTSFVEGVSVAFYFADVRSFQFSIDYSMDNEQWDEALPKTWSTQQTADKTAEYFAFAEEVEALYIRILIYDAKVVATGATNNYGAFYTFAAHGYLNEEGIKAPAVTDALVAAIEKFDSLTASDYRSETYTPVAALVEQYRSLVNATYEQQAAVDSAAAAINAAVKSMCPVDQVLALDAYMAEGSGTPGEALPNMTTGSWYSANASGDNKTAAVFVFAVEAELYQIEIDWYNGSTGRVYEYGLYTSTDNQTWTEVVAPGTLSDGSATTTIDLEGTAVYVKLTSDDGWVSGGTGTVSKWFAVNEIRFFGESVENGVKPVAKFDDAINWTNIQKDLTESLYTADSWKAFDDAIKAVDYTTDLANQATVDAAVQAISDAYDALVFNNVSEIQISHAYWSDMPGEPTWTFGSILFTEPGYTLDQYKVSTSNMTLANWHRIFAAPTATAGVYEITNIISPGAAVTADEAVPENDYGTGFVLAFYTLNENSIADGSQSQYASVEFGNRNAAAYAAMELKPGDKVQLNNVLFTAEDFEAEGEEMQAAWLETTGTWKHRYWDVEGLGEFTPTVINRKSNKTNADGQYVARDQFDDFVSTSTLTKIEAETVVYGDTDNDGEVTAKDLTTLAKYLASWATTINEAAADVDADNEVTAKDLTTLAKYLASWAVELG